MSLLSGLFTLPTGSAFQAYKEANFEVPLEKRTPWGSKRIRKADPEYAQEVSTLPGSHVKTAMQPFLDKSGIRKDLMFIEAVNLGFCSASGTNIFTKGDAAVILAPGFYEADQDACRWVMKHEISHIKHNDLFTIQSVPCVCQLAASIFGMSSLSFFPALGLAYTVGMVSQSLFSQWREAKADDFAIENSSIEELKGGRRFLMAVQETNIKERNTFWKRVANSPSGNQRFDVFHPSITSRIQKIERALCALNAEIDVEGEKQKLDGGFITYMVRKKREMDQAVERVGFFGVVKEMWSL